MTTHLLHVTIAEVIQKLTGILQKRNYEINFQNQDQTMVVAYSTKDTMRMIQVNVHSVNMYLEINVHATCLSQGTSLLTNDPVEEESISTELESDFINSSNTFRLTPEDYAFSLI